jgi:ABC-type antimicrobial peptide transport system permease subunit
VVNEAFVRVYFGNENPVSRLLQVSDSPDQMQIIGVVKDSPYLDLAEPVEPEVYMDFEQSLFTPFLTGLVVRTQGDPELLANTLRHALSIKDADQPVVQVRTLQSLIDENIWQRRFSAWLFSGFAFLALTLSGVGIYGFVAYITTSKRREFGIRLAIGANPSSLFRLAATQSVKPVLLGIALGALGSYWTTRWISSLLYRTSPFDAGVASMSIAVLLALAFAATAMPAVRAARVDPAATLRAD